MRNILTISRRELGSYFNSPVAYIVIIVFLLITGFMFFSQVFLEGEATMRRLFGLCPMLFMFFAPLITMRLLAEEKRTKTFQMLITLPVTDWQVVLGKFFAAMIVLSIAVLLTLPFAYTVNRLGELDWGVVAGGYLGLILLGSSYIAIGLMTSSWTENQIIAALIGFAIPFALHLLSMIVPLLPVGWMRPVVHYASITAHFGNLARGVVDSRDLIYYASLTLACLFMATQSLNSRSWR